MLTLGFTDQQIEDLYQADEWSDAEQHEMLVDAARPGGFDRIFRIYSRAGGKRDRIGYFIYYADSARDFGMIPEALAILRQASNSELASMQYRAEAPLRELISQVQKERGPSRTKLAVGLGLVGIISASAVYLYQQRKRGLTEPF